MACKAILLALDDAGLTVQDLDGFAIYSGSVRSRAGGVGARRARGPLRRHAHLGRRRLRRLARPRRRRDQLGHGRRVRVADDAAAGDAPPRRHAGRRRRRRRRRRRQPVRRRRHPAVDGVHRRQPASCRPGTASRCSPSGTCTCTARSASTSPRSRSRSATTRSAGPTALQKEPLTLDDYFNARMISDPLCLFDYTMETDGAVAVITTSAERARDLRQPPVYIMGSANGGMGRWGPAIFTYFQMPDEYFASSGHRPVAKRMYEMAGVGPDRRRRRVALRPLLADGAHAARGLRLLSASARADRSSPRATSAGRAGRSR